MWYSSFSFIIERDTLSKHVLLHRGGAYWFFFFFSALCFAHEGQFNESTSGVSQRENDGPETKHVFLFQRDAPWVTQMDSSPGCDRNPQTQIFPPGTGILRSGISVCCGNHRAGGSSLRGLDSTRAKRKTETKQTVILEANIDERNVDRFEYLILTNHMTDCTIVSFIQLCFNTDILCQHRGLTNVCVFYCFCSPTEFNKVCCFCAQNTTASAVQHTVLGIEILHSALRFIKKSTVLRKGHILYGTIHIIINGTRWWTPVDGECRHNYLRSIWSWVETLLFFCCGLSNDTSVVPDWLR